MGELIARVNSAGKARTSQSEAHAATAYVLGLSDGGLSAVRSLARRGVPVVGVDSSWDVSGTRSRYCQVRIFSDPVLEPGRLLQELVDEGARLDGQAVLIPSSDAYALFVSRYRSPLSGAFLFNTPAADTLEAIVDKRLFDDLLKKHDLPGPKTFFPTTLDDVRQIEGDIDYPSVIKPYHSHMWARQAEPKGIKVNNRQELLEHWSRIVGRDTPMVIQSMIPGPTTSLVETSVYRSPGGDFLAVFTARKLRQMPLEFGTGTLVESCRVAATEQLAMQLCEALDYQGIANIEFKWDARDASFKIIELNPRLWLQNGLADTCGINFPLIQYSNLLGNPVAMQHSYPDGVRWLDIAGDCEAFLHLRHQREIGPVEWIRSLRGTRCLAAFAADDPVPGLHSIEYGLKALRMPLYVLRGRAGRDHV